MNLRKRGLRVSVLPVLAAVTFLAGCKSRFVQASVINQSASTVRLIEVDYPSASFGISSLAPGAQYPYRFKIQGSGPVSIQFTDGQGKVHTSTGPSLQQGQVGPLAVTISPAYSVNWEFKTAAKP